MSTKYITKQGLRQLDNYKYKPGGSTWLDSKMNYFWEWVVGLIPKTIAPNMITFVGWLLVIFSHTNMLRYDYTFKKDIPSYASTLTAVCLFIYMTLDAIDGKQARRTGSGSPLGQLFDHGCDSFSVTFLILGVCQALKLEVEQVFLAFIVSQLSFWVSNWSQYHTGVLKTKVGQFGVTEAQFTVIFIHLLTAVFGQDFWSIKLESLLPFTISKSAILLNSIASMKVSALVIYPYSFVVVAMNIYLIIKTALKSEDKLRSFLEHFTFVVLIVMEIAWSYMPVYNKYCGLILLNFGLIQSLMICKLIVCSVTKMKFSAIHFQLWPLAIASVALYIASMQSSSNYTIATIFYASIIVNIVIIGVFLYFTIRQITDYLRIYCFSLEKRSKKQ